jgi:hypothetical protein
MHLKTVLVGKPRSLFETFCFAQTARPSSRASRDARDYRVFCFADASHDDAFPGEIWRRAVRPEEAWARQSMVPVAQTTMTSQVRRCSRPDQRITDYGGAGVMNTRALIK